MHGNIAFLVEEALLSMILTHRETRKLFTDSSLVEDAPVFERPLYLVYQEEPLDKALVDFAIQGLREVSLKN